MQNRQNGLDDFGESEATRRKATLFALATAVLTTFLCFFPSFHSGGRHAAFAFEGDALHAIVAHLQLASFYRKHGVFRGIDFFTHNGASEYFLRPNFSVYQPLVLISALLSNPVD